MNSYFLSICAFVIFFFMLVVIGSSGCVKMSKTKNYSFKIEKLSLFYKVINSMFENRLEETKLKIQLKNILNQKQITEKEIKKIFQIEFELYNECLFDYIDKNKLTEMGMNDMAYIVKNLRNLKNRMIREGKKSLSLLLEQKVFVLDY